MCLFYNFSYYINEVDDILLYILLFINGWEDENICKNVSNAENDSVGDRYIDHIGVLLGFKQFNVTNVNLSITLRYTED